MVHLFFTSKSTAIRVARQGLVRRNTGSSSLSASRGQRRRASGRGHRVPDQLESQPVCHSLCDSDSESERASEHVSERERLLLLLFLLSLLLF
jgi:hypothetical protein